MHATSRHSGLLRIAKPRIITEWSKIFHYSNAVQAFQMLIDMQLQTFVFPLPSDLPTPYQGGWTAAISQVCCHCVCEGFRFWNEVSDHSTRFSSAHAFFLIPFCRFETSSLLVINKWYMREAWKWRKKDVDLTHLLVQSAGSLRYELLPMLKEGLLQRQQLGCWFQKIGEHWQMALNLCRTALLQMDRQELQEVDQVQRSLMEQVAQWHLLEPTPVWKLQPCFSGSQIQHMFKVAGKDIGFLLRRQMEWQLSNPKLSSDDCKLFLESAMCQLNAERAKVRLQ